MPVSLARKLCCVGINNKIRKNDKKQQYQHKKQQQKKHRQKSWNAYKTVSWDLELFGSLITSTKDSPTQKLPSTTSHTLKWLYKQIGLEAWDDVMNLKGCLFHRRKKTLGNVKALNSCVFVDVCVFVDLWVCAYVDVWVCAYYYYYL